MSMTMMRPMLTLAGWQKVQLAPDGVSGPALMRRTAAGLTVTLSDEVFTSAADNPPMGLPGRWRHIVISRRDRYPGWDEMRDFVRGCGYFDRSRDVMMLMPPDSRYVNIHPYAFHWLQRQEDGA